MSPAKSQAKTARRKGPPVGTAHLPNCDPALAAMMFQLARPDVLPTGDLGIRKAVQLAYDLPKLPDHDTLTRIAEPWRPHRTLACRYLWASLRNEPG